MRFWLGISIEQPNIKSIIIRVLLLTTLGVVLILIGLKVLPTNQPLATSESIIILVLGVFCIWANLWKYCLKPSRTWDRLFSKNSGTVVEELAQKGHWYKLIPIVYALSDKSDWVRRQAHNAVYTIAGIDSSEIEERIFFHNKKPIGAIPKIKTIITLRYEQNINGLVQVYLKEFEIKPTLVTTRFQYHEKGDCDLDYYETGEESHITINAKLIFRFDKRSVYLRNDGRFLIAEKTELKSRGLWTEDWSVDLAEIDIDTVKDNLKQRIVDALALNTICKYLSSD
jgi:hypothetical protein